MMALARALQWRGHDVTFMTGSLYASQAQRLGLRFVPLDSQERGTLDMSRPNAYQALSQQWHRIGQVAEQFCQFAANQLAASQALERAAPVLVGSTFAVGVRLAQEAYGLRGVTVHMSPACILSSDQPPVFRDLNMPKGWPRWLRRLTWRLVEAVWLDPICTRQLAPLRKRLGLGATRRVMSQWIHSPDLVLGMFPAWFSPPQADWPANTQVVGFPLADQAVLDSLDPELESLLLSGARPLVFNTGSAMRQAGRFFAAAIQVCERLGKHGVILTRHDEHVPSLPHFVLRRSYAPHSLLLPRSSALVSHGGIGSVSMGLLAGIPQLVLPYAHDQFDNARWLSRLGVGAELPSNANASAMGDALQALLTSVQVRESCKAVQRLMQEQGDAVLAACLHIEALVAQT